MKKIIQLPKLISDKIAAGEVVLEPLSVVKELVENSIDAGASSITVEIKNGGKSYIRVTDNGSGIPSDSIELAFSPHATSKIGSEKDLNSITSLGFRGEALTSIAAVSRVEMITKTEEEESGTSIYIEGGEIIHKKKIGTSNGTTVTVSDLFFNTPARLKFMKSDKAESTKIIDLISKLSIAYTNIKFRLINNDNILFSTNGKGDVLKTILTVYGKSLDDELLEVSDKTQDISLTAMISPSDQTKKTRKGQIYFVNGRVIKSKLIENAISEGYREFIFEGRYPTAYIFLNINPNKLDVNVHPAKTEVRFDDKQSVSEIITHSIKKKLTQKDALPSGFNRNKESSTFKNEKNLFSNKKAFSGEKIKNKDQVNVKSLLSSIAKNEAENEKFTESGNDYDGDKNSLEHENLENNSLENNSFDKTMTFVNEEQKSYDEAKHIQEPSTDVTKLKKPEKSTTADAQKRKQTVEKNDFSKNNEISINDLRVIGSVFATYILATDDDMFFIIDQHAAHERINYEKFIKHFNDGDKLTQQLLTPYVFDVPPTSSANMSDWTELINKLGFEIEEFGGNSYMARAFPAFLEYEEAKNMLKDIIENADEKAPTNDIAIEKLISRSCKASIKANDLLKNEEIAQLLKELSKCDNPYACPHGRPVFLKMTKYDIEKLFRRV